MKAAVEALREYPILNSTWEEDRIVIKRRINIGIAVDLEDGFIVPVIRDADQKSIVGLARAIGDLATRARAGALTPDDVAGGTFTINNTGAFGSDPVGADHQLPAGGHLEHGDDHQATGRDRGRHRASAA